MIRRYLFVVVFAIACLAGVCSAAESAPERVAKEEAQAAQQGLPLPRKILGFGVLAVLVVWLFVKGSKK